MKNKIFTTAATLIATVSLSSFALAADSFPTKRLTSGPVTIASDSSMLNASCKGGSCCTTKAVSTEALGGRGTHSSIKKVRACEKSCSLSIADKRAVCRLGRQV